MPSADRMRLGFVQERVRWLPARDSRGKRFSHSESSQKTNWTKALIRQFRDICSCPLLRGPGSPWGGVAGGGRDGAQGREGDPL